eukprot:8536475-Ditylum_brightwellii.AAC.1
MVVKLETADIMVSWVKLHQEDKSKVELLTLEGKLNVKAIADINLFRANTPPHLVPSSIFTVFQSEKAFLTIEGSVITGGLHQWL